MTEKYMTMIGISRKGAPFEITKKPYIGCKSWLCHQCKHYVEFLCVSSMQDICWNKKTFFEPK